MSTPLGLWAWLRCRRGLVIRQTRRGVSYSCFSDFFTILDQHGPKWS